MKLSNRGLRSFGPAVALVLVIEIFASERAAFAHVLDEYLQAAQISIGSHSVVVDLYLTPGVEVASSVLEKIDTNHDGAVSNDEEVTYARGVLNATALTLDGRAAPLAFVTCDYPTILEMRRGLGEIHIQASAALPNKAEPHRMVRFENHFEPTISNYLANAMLPTDPRISIASQVRNSTQSQIEISFNVVPEKSETRSWLREVALCGAGAIATVGIALWIRRRE